MEYLKITEKEELPNIKELSPFKCVVVIEDVVSEDKQNIISTWLCDSGCMYMMAQGSNCNSWDDSVDHANLEQFNFGDINDESFVITTQHDDGPLNEIFWFEKHSAHYDKHELSNCVIFHLSKTNKAQELVDAYKAV